MTFKTMISAIVLAAVSGAFVAPAFAQDASVDAAGQTAMERPMGRHDRGPKFDFAAFDTNGDGTLTAEEFTAARAAKAAALDANNDGKISADELVAQDMVQMKARAEMHAKRMIAARDTDGDGMLSASELASRTAPKDVFDRLDADNDGVVTQAEMDAMQAKMGGRDGKGGRGGHDRMGDHDGKGGHGGMHKRMHNDAPDSEEDNG